MSLMYLLKHNLKTDAITRDSLSDEKWALLLKASSPTMIMELLEELPELQDLVNELNLLPKRTSGLDTNRLLHSAAVARKAYNIAKSEGYDEAFCNKMFMIGYLHDIGYEFSNSTTHAAASAELVSSICNDDVVLNAIKYHGKHIENQTVEWKILNIADMTIDYDGTEVDIKTRLNNIKKRYGEQSAQYLAAYELCKDLLRSDNNEQRLNT